MRDNEAGKRIREVRKQKGFSLQRVADSIGCSVQAISQYERGTRPLTIDMVKKIAVALNVPWWELAGLPVEEIDGQKHVRRLDYEEKMLANYEKFHGQEAQRREALLSHYDRLNGDGQQKAVERVAELAEVPRYQKKTRPPLNT